MSIAEHFQTPDGDSLPDVFAIPSAPTVESVAQQLHDLRQLKADLGMIESELVAFLADVLPRGGQAVEGVGWVEAKGGAAKKVWDGKRLVGVIAARSADAHGADPETGEVRPIAAIAEAVAADVAACGGLLAPSASWRTGPLRERGIEPAQFYEAEGSRQSIVIREP